MSDRQRETEHEIVVSAPAAGLYRLLAGVENWPRVFPPTIYVDVLERTGHDERIRIWATANGEPKSWTSRRVLDPEHRRIDFHQEVPAPPVAAMNGTWLVEPLGEREARVRLRHGYRAVDDDPASSSWIDEAVDRNSRAELDALKRNAELAHSTDQPAFAFEDTVQVDGSAEDVYAFLNDAHLWARRLPHVSSVDFRETGPDLQTLEMETRAEDGSTHTTKSYRVTFPHRKIAYKQVTLPALMTVHTGYWTVTENEDGVAASSQHAVLLNTANIARVLGADATVADAREFVRSALSTNSLATLAQAKGYAEKAR